MEDEWQKMKKEWKILKVYLVANQITIDIGTSHSKEKLSSQNRLVRNKEVEEGKMSFSNITKAWDKNNKYLAWVDLVAYNHMNNVHYKEVRERKNREPNIVIK